MIIVYSSQDPAGSNIASELMQMGFKETKERFEDYPVYSYKTHKLFRTQSPIIQAEVKLKTDYVIFASKHKAVSGKPCLTVHPSGNFSRAELGGKERELCLTSADLIKSLFLELVKEPPQGYDVSLEVTHHGPTSLLSPAAFIELGSGPEQWKDTNASKYIAQCIINVLDKGLVQNKPAIGFGGGHYSPTFSRKLPSSPYSLSHICAEYNLGCLDKELVSEMIGKTKEKVHSALLDWKGMNAQEREKVSSILSKTNLEIVKVK